MSIGASKERCDDWDCPALVSCGHAFWRSKAYAEMAPRPPPTRKFGREPGAEACPDYFRDQPRAWIRETLAGDGG